MAIVLGLDELFTKTTLDAQFSGFYLFGCGLFFTPIALVPFTERRERNGLGTQL